MRIRRAERDDQSRGSLGERADDLTDELTNGRAPEPTFGCRHGGAIRGREGRLHG